MTPANSDNPRASARRKRPPGRMSGAATFDSLLSLADKRLFCIKDGAKKARRSITTFVISQLFIEIWLGAAEEIAIIFPTHFD